jgi:hypothetical protein
VTSPFCADVKYTNYNRAPRGKGRTQMEGAEGNIET